MGRYGKASVVESYYGDKDKYANKNADTHNKTIKKMRTRSMDESQRRQQQDLGKDTDDKETRDPDKWRHENNITITQHGKEEDNLDLRPFWEFEDAPFDRRVWHGKGFERPTVIQSQAWPMLLTSRDLICIAKTGSGKTLTFLLPLFHKLYHKQSKTTSSSTSSSKNSKLSIPPTRPLKPVPSILILAPTRELAHQIQEQARMYSHAYSLKSLCLYGGSPKFAQISMLQQGVHVIIATPGRLNDLMEMGKVVLDSIKWVVLDEADRMLDMGFEPQINKIFTQLPTTRQTLLFSATWPSSIRTLSFKFLTAPLQINIGSPDTLVVNSDIRQFVLSVKEDNKMEELVKVLKDLLQEEENGNNTHKETNDRGRVDLGGKKHAKCIVFVSRKIKCHDLANVLWEDGFSVDALHGDRPQYERSKIMNAFKNNTLRMLVATDVAARGLDVKDVGVVINYDMPTGINASEDYVHRIGRTGRAGVKGRSYSFFTEKDKKVAAPLIKLLKQANHEIPKFLHDYLPRFTGRPYGRGGRYDRFGKYGTYNNGRGGRGYMMGGRSSNRYGG